MKTINQRKEINTMKTVNQHKALWLSAALLWALSLPAQAGLNNGGFESGFSGWTIADQVGSEGTFACKQEQPVLLTALWSQLRPAEPLRP